MIFKESDSVQCNPNKQNCLISQLLTKGEKLPKRIFNCCLPFAENKIKELLWAFQETLDREYFALI